MKLTHPLFNKEIAHRGYHDKNIDENSLAAFDAAINEGLAIEIDVHLLKSGELVVIHDPNLDRVTGFDVAVSTLNKDDLIKYPLLKTKTSLPLLKDVLALVRGQVPLLIELKVENKFNKAIADRLLMELEHYDSKEKVALQSFNPYCVKYLKTVQNTYKVGQLSTQNIPNQSKLVNFMFKHLFILLISKPDFLSMDVTYIKKRKVTRLRNKGLPILAWTIDSDEKLITGRKCADNIIFENINYKQKG